MSTLQQAANPSMYVGASGRRPHIILNPITVVGALIACVGLGGAGFALVAGFLDEDPSAIKGILGYVVMPTLVLVGVVLMLAGIALGARRQVRSSAASGGSPALHIGLGSRYELLGIATFGAIVIGSLSVLGGTTYRAIEFMESTTFCGTCHTVMQPQVEAHESSPHAAAECTKCHIAYRSGPLGPNVTAYISAKVGGMRQMAGVMTGNYDQPIRAPADKIPSTTTTCEGCHAPNKDYGVMIRQFNSYAPDEKNSRSARALAFPVGGGKDGDTKSIHWHATATLWYQATDETRSEISWVGVETPDGIEEWVNPTAPVLEASERQLMSCIDCHNRVGHKIPSPDELVDKALDDGRLDRSLPYIKREAVELLGGNGEGDPDVLAAQFSQTMWFDQLARFYNDNYPQVAASQKDAIRTAISELKMMSKQILYPDMRANWLTYPDNLSHRLPEGIKTLAGQQTPGCFRCHGTLVNSLTRDLLPGTMGGDSCLSCHGSGEGSQLQISTADPTQAQSCALCHVNVDLPQLAGSGSTDELPKLPLDRTHQR